MMYGASVIRESAENEDLDVVNLSDEELEECVQLIAYDEMSRMPAEELVSLSESGELEALCEKQVLNKKTMMRLSKADDKKRRVKLIAYKLAKDSKNVHWEKMMTWRDKWKGERDEILRIFGKKAGKIADIAQREYIKRAKKQKA